MESSDFVGGRGEAIAFSVLTTICRVDAARPYFWPHYLGDKCETFDFFVELVDAGEVTPYFFVQVKSTRRGYTRSQSPPRLRVAVAEKDVRRMASFPAPTYVIGVHEVEERAFIISVHGTMAGPIPSIATAHELNCETLRRLWHEVRAFWASRDMAQGSTVFPN